MTKGVSAAAIDPRDYTGQRWLLITVATKYNEVYVEAPIRELKVGETLIPVTINLPARNDYIITALEFVKHDYGIKEGIDCEIIGFGTAHNIGIQNGETKIVNVVISPVQYEVDYPTVVESATPFNATLTFTAASSIDIDNAILTCGNDPDLLKTVHARSMNSIKYGNKWLTVASLSGSTKLVNEDCACTNLKIDVKLRHIDNYAWINSSNQLKRSGVKFKIIIPGLALQHSALPSITIKKSTGGITF
ncbi:MAG: hypothetical protein PHY48_17320 [Candidatus Cloacimonetes bacterium]|nr:hypothetical protein [Candidatus Cloacimonadota bacterium]